MVGCEKFAGTGTPRYIPKRSLEDRLNAPFVKLLTIFSLLSVKVLLMGIASARDRNSPSIKATQYFEISAAV